MSRKERAVLQYNEDFEWNAQSFESGGQGESGGKFFLTVRTLQRNTHEEK